ncbi:LPS translocon maturation chaperone LptM [Hydrogenophaga sp. RWCD_12]|uniref:LPS translocon maturation chaperone LptM n=1 Tax=Hydrogenophaga sp. RWCD_12 TaxID=3391190 RepID=UPI0039851A5B
MSNQTILGRRPVRCSALALLVAASVIAGCGQKGPLYLPPPPGSASAPAAPQPSSPAATDNKVKPADAATPTAR